MSDNPLKNKNIVFASQENIKSLTQWVRVVLTAIGYPTAFVTDLSKVGDFCLEDDELQEVSEKLGFSVSHNDFVVDLARKLKEQA